MSSNLETCKGVVFRRIQKVEYVDIDKPQQQSSSDALLRVIVCGICGSDLHPYHGREPCATETVFGHECVGEVIAKGEDVTSIAVGDLVVVPFSTACGSCFFCMKNLSARCTQSQLFGWKDMHTGNGIHGAQSEYVVVPNAHGSLYRVPPDFSPEEALLLGDILSTALYAACQAGLAGWDEGGNSVSTVLSLANSIAGHSGIPTPPPRPASEMGSYAVVGCGPVGLLTVAVIRGLLMWRGFHPNDIIIYAIDAVPERLTHAERWGAIPLRLNLANGSTCDSNDTLLDGFSPEGIKHEIISTARCIGRGGVDAVIECVGTTGALRLAYDLVSPGGNLTSIGVHSATFPFAPSDIYDKNLTYRSGRCPARSMMPAAEIMLRWLRNSDLLKGSVTGNIHLDEIITHRMHLSDAAEAYDIFDKKRDGCLKPVLYPFELPTVSK